ncbi:MAG: 2,3-bisphosphoglycerate-independent phosphoglycerate mutase [Malacoplasma sp.]|nr:2,3-bisphosphoglycerate-independent phosphoglycerate mutase [Malacoplasma sp.]
MKNRKVILMILDGLGYSTEKHGNAVLMAKTPNIDMLYNKYPHNLIEASGKAVGLPEGQMGNSEVGHLNIGAGRIVYTGLSLINNAIETKEFFKNQAFLGAFKYIKEKKTKLHLMGLVSHGGVHSSYEHIIALLQMCAENNVEPIVHIFTDGRDVDPKAFLNDLNDFEEQCKKYNAKIATISGRYYAMDRDKRWDRSELAYDNIIGLGKTSFKNLKDYVQESYNKNVTDEFIVPAYNANYDISDIKLENNDAVIFMNFRPDRARQLVHFIYGSKYYDAKPQHPLSGIYMVIMAQYEGIEPTAVAFPPTNLVNVLGAVIEKNNLSQLRIAETEKYAHVTFFFDGGKEINYKNEQKILVNSPKVATYDLQPEMSAPEITEKLLPCVGKFDLIVVNYANCDMVGHTGKLDATIKAVETVDKQVGAIYEQCQKEHVTLFLTADHGNAEEMLTKDDKPVTKHTTNKVVFLVTDTDYHVLDNGKLANIAPSILSYMGVEIPKEMNEKVIVCKK